MIRIALSSWSLHTEFLNPHISGLNAFRFPEIAKDTFGVRSIEFYEGDYAEDFLSEQVDLSYAREVRQACDAIGVSIVCAAAVNNLTTNDPGDEAADSRRIDKWVEHCRVLECPVIRINSGRRRLTPELAERLVSRLRAIALRHADAPIVFALENHPHGLRSVPDIELFRKVISDVDLPNVKTCPDVGAVAPGFWERAFKALAPLAAHVHLKPAVTDPSGKALPISEYGRTIKEILESAKFDSAVSFEFTEFRDPNADHRQATTECLKQLFDVFGQSPLPLTPLPPRPPVPLRSLKVNGDKELSPTQQILQLLADGCESNLRREVSIHDFATDHDIHSIGASHDPDAVEAKAERGSFCARAELCPRTARFCARFKQQKLEHIRQSVQTEPQICICPLGLMELVVPVRDEDNIYAAIFCSSWIEQGTEGMTTESLELETAPGSRERAGLEEAFLVVPSYSRQELLKSRELLERLAGDLANLYKQRREEKMLLERGAAIINAVRRAGERATSNSFLQKLPDLFQEFVKNTGFGHLALYSRVAVDPSAQREAWQYQRITATDEGSFDLELVFEPEAALFPEPANPTTVRNWFQQHFDARPNQRSLAFPHSLDLSEVIVFAFEVEDEIRVSSHVLRLLDQFAEENLQLIAILRQIDQIKERERQLEVFIDHAKHALSGPLQGISDRLRILDRWSRDGKIDLGLGRGHFENLQDFAHAAARVIQLFTGRVRIAGRAQLREQYRFAQVNLAYVLKRSVARFQHSAMQRSTEFHGLQSFDQLPVIEGDSEALIELFDNLIENAVKFANHGAGVYFQGHACSGEAGQDWKLAAPGVRVAVKDFGLGIPAEDMERIFLPYVQSRLSSSRRVIPGTGLGLAICRHIVEAHGGRIWAECEVPVENQRRPYPENLQDCWVRLVVDLPCQQNQYRRETAE